MRQIPKKVRVLGLSFNIKLVSLEVMAKKAEGENTVGLFVGSEGTIYIAKELPLDMQWATLWHEMLHAADQEFKLFQEHEELYRVAGTINAIINDNFV